MQVGETAPSFYQKAFLTAQFNTYSISSVVAALVEEMSVFYLGSQYCLRCPFGGHFPKSLVHITAEKRLLIFCTKYNTKLAFLSITLAHCTKLIL